MTRVSQPLSCSQRLLERGCEARERGGSKEVKTEKMQEKKTGNTRMGEVIIDLTRGIEIRQIK